MDPFLLRTVSYWAVFIGTGLVLGGSVGTWYFGNKAEQLAPYRQPIRTGVTTVDVVIESTDQVNTTYADQGGYLILGKGSEALITTSATECTARQLGNNRVLFKGVFAMDAHDSAAGKPITFLREAEFAQIFFRPMLETVHVVQGTAVLTINSLVRLEFAIPEQDTKDRLVLVRNVAPSLAELR